MWRFSPFPVSELEALPELPESYMLKLSFLITQSVSSGIDDGGQKLNIIEITWILQA